MATTTYPNARTAPASSPAGCGCPAPCPVCGGLQCLCRPRFFAGQILTDDDLNRLEQYVIQKNKLHNRYLHGWGVVCGLKVGCSSCRDRVTIEPGYALSPCGDDIIVCQEDGVSVSDLIRRCRPPSRADANCPPQAVGNGNDCQDATEDWILAICYDEQPSRGVMPLRNGNSGSCGCAGKSGGNCNCGGKCGGAGSGGCGCGKAAGSARSSASAYNGSSRTSARTAPAQCEPTLTCEGYTFTVYKAPKPSIQERFSALASATNTCFTLLTEQVSNMPDPTTASAADAQQWLCSTRQLLADLFASDPPQNCALLDLLAQIVCPPVGPNDTASSYEASPAFQAAVQLLIQAHAEYIRACFCDRLLPPCPAPVDCNCVPLATVTIRRSDHNILKVCNWGPRQFALTFPDITYWLESSGIGKTLRLLLERLCCGALRVSTPEQLTAVPVLTQNAVSIAPALRSGVVSNNSASAAGASAAASAVTPLAALISQAWTNQNRNIDVRTLAMATLGISNQGTQPVASAFEVANPLAFLLANQVLRPTFETTLSPELTQAWRRLAVAANDGRATESPAAQPAPAAVAQPATAQPAAATAADLESLKTALEELQKTVAAQQATIKSLQKKK